MKKLLAVLSAVLVVAMLLTACSAPAANNSSSQDSTPADDSASVSTPQDTVVNNNDGSQYAGMGDGKELVYWCEWNESESQWDVYKETIARFEKDTGYTVKVEHYGRDITQLFPAAIDAGQRIDVCDLNGTVPQEGYFTDIDEYVDKYGIREMVLPAYDLYEKSVSLTDDGHWYAVPSQPFFGGVFYNKDIFKEAGIETLPETWDEFMDACEKIKAIGKECMTIDDAYCELPFTYQAALALGGEQAVNDLYVGPGEHWKAVLPIAEKFQEMREKGYWAPSVGGNQFPAAQNGEFAMGTAAMYGFDGSWVCNEVHDITGDDFNWGFMFWPSMTTDENRALELACQQIFVPTTCEDVDGAVLLLKYMIDSETCVGLRDQCQCIPMTEGVEWPAALADVQKAAAEAEVTFGWNVKSGTNIDKDTTTLVETYFHKLIGGTITAEEFVQHMVDGK